MTSRTYVESFLVCTYRGYEPRSVTSLNFATLVDITDFTK